MSNRRQFIKHFASVTAFAGAANVLPSCTDSNTTKITILHTNDVHSQIDPLPANHSRYPNLGGFARRATRIQNIRKHNPNTLLLDAGDVFQGTPYFNFYGGELEFKLMSALRYDAMTLGNHDFDNGIEGLLAQLPHANFPIICSNYDFRNTALDGHIMPYRLVACGGIQIGLFGLGIQLDGLVSKRHYKETNYLDPIETAQEMVHILKDQKDCQLIICLSHLGFEYRSDSKKISDQKLAQSTQDIDIIIGGHTHTLLPKPLALKNANGNTVWVNQCGKSGVYMGQLDCYFEGISTKTTIGKSIPV